MTSLSDALREGRPVLLPTDTVYGLCAAAGDPAAVERAHRLKGRTETQPSALLAPDVDTLLRLIPQLPERGVRALLPASLTLVVPNPAGRFAWLAPGRATLGVRAPVLDAEVARAVAGVEAVMATSANLRGGPDPRRLDDVPPAIRAGCGAELDLGALPGIASTVLDLTGPEPRVLREGAVPAGEALARAAAVL